MNILLIGMNLTNMEKTKILLTCILTLFLCSCEGTSRLDQRWVIENQLDEPVILEAYYFSRSNNGQSKSSKFTFEPLNSVKVYEITSTPQEGRAFAPEALRLFFQVDFVDSLVFTFTDGAKLSFLWDEESFLNPLIDGNPSVIPWTTNVISENEVEYTFRISSLHKNQAN